MSAVLLISGGAIQAIQFFAALSLLILLHEFGHYLFARLFKTRVEKFYLFFDFLFPFPSVLNFSLFKKKVGETEFGLGWFPLGGYVKIAGMVDESMDKDQLAEPAQPWEYRSKKAYQRLFIMLGGIIMNLVVACGIYAYVFGYWGEEYLPTENARYGIVAGPIAQEAGLRSGDKIIAVGGKTVDRFHKIVPEFLVNEAKSFTVIRDGVETEVPIPEGTIRRLIKEQSKVFIQPRIPTVVGMVSPASTAEKMGLQAGDSIVGINDQPIFFFDEFEETKSSLAGESIRLNLIRNGESLSLEGQVPESGILGFGAKGYTDFFATDRLKYGPVDAIGRGFAYTGEQIGNYWKQLKMIFTSPEVKVSESLGGLVSFGKLFAPVFDWQAFLMLTAFVSIILAIMNLLPIPGLDGGYVVFLIIEMISGRKVPEKVMEISTTVGLVILLALMLYANGLDIFRLFGG